MKIIPISKKILIWFGTISFFLIGILGIRASLMQWEISWTLPNRIAIVLLTFIFSGISIFLGISFFFRKESISTKIEQIPESISMSLVVLFASSGVISLFILSLSPNERGFLTSYWIYFENLRSIIELVVAISILVSIFFLGVYIFSRNHSLRKIPLLKESNKFRFFLGSIFLIFIFCESLVYSHQTGIIPGGDADDYLTMTSYRILTPEFYAGSRPPATALLYKALAMDISNLNQAPRGSLVQGDKAGNAILLVQTLIHVLCWGSLGLSVTRVFSSWRLRLIGTAMVLLLALSPPVQVWNHLIGSDSLSISLTVLLIGLSIFLIDHFRWHTFYSLIFVILLWANTRESNTLLILALVPIMFIFGVINKSRWAFIILAAVTVLIYSVSSHFSDIRNRWVIPLVNVVYQRILPDENNLEYFKSQGMPVNSALLSKQGQWACSPVCPYSDPEIDEFWKWISTEGRISYMRYLLHKPLTFIAEPLKHLDEILEIKPVKGFDILPGFFWNTLFFKSLEGIQLILILLMGIFLVFSRVWTRNPGISILLIVFILLYPIMFLSYHGDAYEIYRHSIQANVLVRLVFWLFLIFCVDQVLFHLKVLQPESSPQLAEKQAGIMEDMLKK